MVVHRDATEDIPGRRRAGSGAWAGLLNTHFWVDRTTGIASGIYTQSLPFVTREAIKTYYDFEEALYASLSPGCNFTATPLHRPRQSGRAGTASAAPAKSTR